jgi:hypothetical protein
MVSSSFGIPIPFSDTTFERLKIDGLRQEQLPAAAVSFGSESDAIQGFFERTAG